MKITNKTRDKMKIWLRIGAFLMALVILAGTVIGSIYW